MQIIRFEIDEYKCLRDFEIQFSATDGGSSTIIIGENGTGKSSMLESLLDILMSFESNAVLKSIDYDYYLEYFFSGSNYSIVKAEKKYEIKIDGQPFLKSSMQAVKGKLKKENKRIFPSRVMIFYSGTNSSMFSRVKEVNKRYLDQCRKALLNYGKQMRALEASEYEHFPKRRFNYCDDALTEVFAAAILGGQDSKTKTILKQKSHIAGLKEIILSVDMDEMLLRYGVFDRVNEITADVYSVLEFVDPVLGNYLRTCYATSSDGIAYFILSNLEELGVDPISLYNFFEKLLSMFKAHFEVYVFHGLDSVSCSELSEGQRQLIKMLGMLSLCSSEDCLILMDEPDAHMNPNWKYEIKPVIDECLQDAVNSQAIIATHDPLVINGVDKAFIRIFAHDQTAAGAGRYRTRVIEPTEDTEGLGIDGLLQSEYYGLKTSYDKKSSDKFIRRLELYSKLINEEAGDEEKKELMELTKELGMLPISYNSIDFLYDDFIRVFKESELFSKEYLSYDQVLERREKIKEIIAALYEGQV